MGFQAKIFDRQFPTSNIAMKINEIPPHGVNIQVIFIQMDGGSLKSGHMNGWSCPLEI